MNTFGRDKRDAQCTELQQRAIGGGKDVGRVEQNGEPRSSLH